MDNSKINIFQEINFDVLASSFEDAVKTSLDNFWEIDFRVKFSAINDFRDFKEDKTISKINFFSSQISVPGHNPVVFRLSENFVQNILEKILSIPKTPFNIRFLTDLETKILNNFCEFLYKKIDLILKPIKEVKATEQSNKNINIVFLISMENDECSKIMLSIPKDRIDLKELQKQTNFRDENFLTSTSNVKIRAGSTKISLQELKSLTSGDIVLLENSNVSRLTLISGNLVKQFNVKADSSLVLDIDEDEEEFFEEDKENLKNNEVKMEKNLWDDIQIEINAEFEKVKMTIGELKQITQGQIVDLGSVFNNEISLLVENKVVAKGELVIINDRYAIKLNKVLSQKAQEAIKAQPPKQNAPEAVKQEVKPAPEPNVSDEERPIQSRPISKTKEIVEDIDEDFDYSDFEK